MCGFGSRSRNNHCQISVKVSVYSETFLDQTILWAILSLDAENLGPQLKFFVLIDQSVLSEIILYLVLLARPLASPAKHTFLVFRGTSVVLLTCLKNALRLFIYNKSLMNPEHEFALVVLTSEANWVSPPLWLTDNGSLSLSSYCVVLQLQQ